MLNKNFRILFFIVLSISGFILLSSPQTFSSNNETVHVIELNDDTINPVTAAFIEEAIDNAVDKGVEALVIKLDTPGGLLTSTRQIVKNMLTSKVPVVVYIAPSGSRAGSAGVFITYASHIAAMAPSTNIGAAHPVQIGQGVPKKTSDWGELRELIEELRNVKEKSEQTVEKQGSSEEQVTQKDEEPIIDELGSDQDPMEDKILNDTVAFIKAIAKKRNRNEEWAVLSVTKSESITEQEALETGVVEYIAENTKDLLAQIDGKVVDINGQEIILRTKDANIETIEMGAHQKFFNVLANPNIAYILMILGFYGLLFEITHPGIGVPGVLGAIFLILAFYSMQTLPTNYAGLALLVLGLVLLIAEAYTPTFGLLTLGGVSCMILGSMLLFDSVDPVMRVSKSAILAFALTTSAIMIFVIQRMVKIRVSKVQTGQEEMVGLTAEAMSNFDSNKKGKVFVHGELWNAVSPDQIKKGDEVTVIKVDGLILEVENKKGGE